MMLTRQKKAKKKKEQQKRMEKHVTKERGGERAETETFMNTKLWEQSGFKEASHLLKKNNHLHNSKG